MGDRDHVKAAALRRLFVEAYTLAAADLRSKVERTADDPPKRLPVAERAARFEKLRRRLVGVSLEGDLEPSHHLVDRIVQMVEDGALKYVPWADCTTRADELVGVKVDKTWKPDSTGFVKDRDRPPR